MVGVIGLVDAVDDMVNVERRVVAHRQSFIRVVLPVACLVLLFLPPLSFPLSLPLSLLFSLPLSLFHILLRTFLTRLLRRQKR
jgi:hypothetical protein